MQTLNRIQLIGFVGAEPKIITRENGNHIARFSLATHGVTKQDENAVLKQYTDWHRVVAFGLKATVVERFIQAGTLLNIIGRLRYSQYEDQQQIKHNVVEIVVMELIVLRDGKQKVVEEQALSNDVEQLL